MGNQSFLNVNLLGRHQNLSLWPIEHLGGVSYVHLHTPTGEKLIIEQRGSALERGVETINLALDVADVMIFDAQTNLRIR